MSKQVTISDVFDEDLDELLLAAMRYVKRPRDPDLESDYIHANLYEYDTRIQKAIHRAVITVLMDSNT